MPAPTALLQPTPAAETVPQPAPENEDEVLLDVQNSNPAETSAARPPEDSEDTEMVVDEEGRPRFAPGKDVVRMNIKEKRVELRTSKFTQSNEALQMGADFVSAFAMGFDIDDAIALLRLDSLYIQSFDIKDVRQTLGQDALGRAIGRIAGKDGKTKFAIENATKTRIVLAGSRVHILGAFENIGMARESIVSLVLGQQPGKVYNNLRIIASRMKERF
ncbi:hypothetical protein VTK56DRAFT_7295 [Thermocarpiscus australiensis]